MLQKRIYLTKIPSSCLFWAVPCFESFSKRQIHLCLVFVFWKKKKEVESWYKSGFHSTKASTSTFVRCFKSISMLLAQPLAAASLDGLQEKCWPWSSPEGRYIGSRHVLLNSDHFRWVNIIYSYGCARSDVWLGILLYFLNKLPDLNLYVIRYSMNPSNDATERTRWPTMRPQCPRQRFTNASKSNGCRVSSNITCSSEVTGDGAVQLRGCVPMSICIYVCTLTCFIEYPL